MGKELEIKLGADGEETLERVLRWEALAPLRRGEEQTFRMRTVYYDTADGQLAARRWTLRCRQENETSVICLKTPRDPGEEKYLRGEWQTQSAQMAEALPALAAQGAPQALLTLDAGALRPLCGAEFTRQTVLLALEDGSICELACDRGVFTGGGRRRSFAEVELELKQGESGRMLALARRLMQAVSLAEEPKSKFQRAKALAAGE